MVDTYELVIFQVLMVCRNGNVISEKKIKSCGGILSRILNLIINYINNYIYNV